MIPYGETLQRLGARARALRIIRQLQQAEVATRAGIGVATVKRFERSGRASMENVLRIATVLGADAGFDALFVPPRYRTLDEALSRPRPGPTRIRRRA
jgi:transcriptional regulator with XRE-family HTH domain